ncbi:GTP 3',8-cyclase MoaA [Bacillus sp. FJAT-49711]|uniref:GTP 3',8-cyclase MoaA n=1 Tax=Bacillus sp. FJAT-49711 TaxID=2833585 RepID=UPI001BC9F9E3|nr:GTP 3',8-cyclase MoaA [Bacillus sp. FJAT-49711]MBS4216818.1 GTP 3',8-cyclase MoaA [Bacillus sp. FJAT-49711]
MMIQTIRDQMNRPMRDLRISVTDRCNFRCTYCMPKEIFGDDYAFMPKSELLSYEEIERFATIFAKLGVKKIRLTGGEPLMRRDIDLLIKRLYTIEGIEDIGLTTNGMLLKQYGERLLNAGLKRINISLDALDPKVFGQINGRGISPDLILERIEYAKQLGFRVKVNMVVQKGLNEHQIVPMAKYCKEHQLELRFIEFMDVGNDNAWSFKKVITKKEIIDLLSKEFVLDEVKKDYFGEVATRYRYNDSDTQVGFITSVSESFCSSCTRARLSSDGKLYTCLFASEGFDLRSLIRSEATNEELEEAIKGVWQKRTDRYSDERTANSSKKYKKINMSYIGG